MLEVSNRQKEILANRLAENRLRRLRSLKPLKGQLIECEGHQLVNFSSNDYLGLSQHSLLKERSIKFTERYGTGSGASRLITGNLDCYQEIEDKLARLKGTEASLVMNSGFQTNLTVLTAVAFEQSFVTLDRFSHNSLIQGATLGKGTWTRFHHNNHEDLEFRLTSVKSKNAQERWVVTESVFGMDGDQTDIERLVRQAKSLDAKTFVDEAHSTGVLGSSGMGLAAGKGVDIVMGTFGKACGSFGSYIACTKEMKEYLVNCCSGFVYSTGLPPPVLGAIDAALELIPEMIEERNRLTKMANHVRETLQKSGFSTGASSTQIIPVLVGEDANALELSHYLESRGLMAFAIRPPTVPEGTARIRISLSSAHTDSQIEQLLEALIDWKEKSWNEKSWKEKN